MWPGRQCGGIQAGTFVEIKSLQYAMIRPHNHARMSRPRQTNNNDMCVSGQVRDRGYAAKVRVHVGRQ